MARKRLTTKTTGAKNLIRSRPKRETDEGKDEGKEEKTRKSRYKGVKWMLTYSGIPGEWDHPEMIEAIKRDLPPMRRWRIGKEQFKSGGTHWHVYILLLKEIDTTADGWGWIKVDGKEYSCSYKKAKDYHAEEYAMKDMNCTTSDDKGDFWCTSKNFSKMKNDHDAWKQWRYRKIRDEIVWPLILPTGRPISYPDPKEKRRHWWFYGAPDWGKTAWLCGLGNIRYFTLSGAENPMEHYDDEPLIIITKPAGWWLIEVLSDTHGTITKLPGKQRYAQVSLLPNTTRTIIYIGNDSPEDAFTLKELPMFMARFNICYLEATDCQSEYVV